MRCSSCGSEIATASAFCAQCGAPASAAAAAAQSAEPIRFTLEASALGLFGRTLLMGLGCALLVPAPWVLSWWFRWLAGQIQANDGRTLTFHGTAASMWKLVVLFSLFFITSAVLEEFMQEDVDLNWLVIPYFLLQLAGNLLYWALARWVINHAEFAERRWRFDGGAWGYLGWTLLVGVSVLTIIGWAWALVGFYSWAASHVRDAGGSLTFTGEGHQVLWRTLAMVVFCLPILTIPWAIKWYYDWLVSRIELIPAAT